MQAAVKMEQLPLAAVEPAKPDNERRPKAPPMVRVRRAIATALYYLHALDRCDPGTARTLRKAIFNDAGAPLTEAERARFGNLFRASIFQRQSLRLWWLPKERHITSRRTYELVEKRRRLPEGAIFIGSYEAPVHESAFLDDLDDLLRCIREGCEISGEPE
jgi:hypothetical protein